MPVQAQANNTFYKNGILTKAHTDGDIYTHFTKADVLVVSDALVTNTYPILDYVTGGWIGGLQKANEKLLEIAGANTQIIPAEGAVQNIDDVQRQIEMLEMVFEEASLAYLAAKNLEEFRAMKPMNDYIAERGDPTLFLALLYRRHLVPYSIPCSQEYYID